MEKIYYPDRRKKNYSLNNLKIEYLKNVNNIINEDSNHKNLYNEILKKENFNNKLNKNVFIINKEKVNKYILSMKNLKIYINEQKYIKFVDNTYIELKNNNTNNCYINIKIVNYKKSKITVYINNSGFSCSKSNYSMRFTIKDIKLKKILTYKNTITNILIDSEVKHNTIQFYSYFVDNKLNNKSNNIERIRKKYFGSLDNLTNLINNKKGYKLNTYNIKTYTKKFNDPKIYTEKLKTVIDNKKILNKKKIEKLNYMIVKKNLKVISKKFKNNKKINLLKKFKTLILLIRNLNYINNFLRDQKKLIFLKNNIFCLKFVFKNYKQNQIVQKFQSRIYLNVKFTTNFLKLKNNYKDSIKFFLKLILIKFSIRNDLLWFPKKKDLRKKVKKSIKSLVVYFNFYKFLFVINFKELFNKYRWIKNLNNFECIYGDVWYFFINYKIDNKLKIKDLHVLKETFNKFTINYLNNI